MGFVILSEKSGFFIFLSLNFYCKKLIFNALYIFWFIALQLVNTGSLFYFKWQANCF